MVRVCPNRDTVCPHGMSCPYAKDRYTCTMMSETSGTIFVEEVKEHDDGSATYTMSMDDQSRQLVINEGIRLIFNCAAYKVDLEDVYDWIASHKTDSVDMTDASVDSTGTN